MNLKNIIVLIGTLLLAIVIVYMLVSEPEVEGSDIKINQQAQSIPTSDNLVKELQNTNATTSVATSTTTAVATTTKVRDLKHMTATIKTSMGDIVVALDRAKSPSTVDNFTKLADAGYYNGTRFHRVIKDFMIQTGDPLSKDQTKKMYWGTGGPGYKFKDELSGDETYERGTLAMANSGPDTNGSQFFIMTGENVNLPPSYTVFGKVTKGIETALAIQDVETDGGDKPVKDVIVTSITIK